MSSESDDDSDSGNGVDLTSFLFGNIDSEGKLENDIFDTETKKNLSTLSRFGLRSFLNDVIPDEDPANESLDENSDEFTEKDATAVDYSDINELAEDCSPAFKNEAYDDIEDAIPANCVNINDPNNTKYSPKKNYSTDEENNESGHIDDRKLMPPPPFPIRSTSIDSKPNQDMDTDMKMEKPLERKLDTPLAAMLPSKYANVDVRDLFPDFRPDKVLRFSRLFGPGKPSSLPQIWRHVKKKRRKRKQSKDYRMAPNVGSDSTSDNDEPRYGFSLNYGPEPTPEFWASDDEDKLLRISNDEDIKAEGPDSGDNNENKPKVADWRFGPAQIWYDMLEVPESGDGFNYGFKFKDNKMKYEKEEEEVIIKGEEIADDAYLMVSQVHWEDDVVWDGNDIKAKVLQKLNSKTNAAGWLPSSGSRTAAFSQPGKVMPVQTSSNNKIPIPNQPIPGKAKGQISLQQPEQADDTWYSIFPVENEELIYGKWEDEIIWDADNMQKVPKPKVLTLDPNDENIILGIPDDIDPSKVNKNLGPPPKIKIPHPHVKKSKILLGKAGVINVLQEDTPPPPPKSPDRDPFNISNDVYYMAKSAESVRLKVSGGNLIQHSTPVVELRAPFIPTHMGPMKLRMFHRQPMKKYSHGTLAAADSAPVLPLVKHILKKAKTREAERIASGGGDVFFMRNPDDLSGKDGDIILVEFCEEHPPLMNQVGMCSKIKNYYKRKVSKDSGPPDFKYGETALAHTSPFLGILAPGSCIQALENNMYRAPIYPHTPRESDFLVIRTRNSYWIREFDALFTVGQECPLYEVPGPNSKRANNFARDFLQVFIYRLFWKSKDNPRRIKMDDIKRAFPAHSESSIRKRLKQCADFKRTGMDSNWWVIKPEFRLPSEEEIRAMVSPEQCCAFFSMIAAEQRLKDAGYGEKFIFAQQDDDDEEQQLKMDDEVKVAPWNTTRAYIQAMRGKCLLQLTGPADPTGCGEGFSYVRVPNKPTQTKEEQESQPKRTVTGTDADLRRLPLNKAKELLRKFKVPEEEIKKLSRWEVIDVVRTLSTEKAKAGEQGMDKFSRGNRFSIAEHQERYKEECQRIFDLQNKVLASAEVLSTDEDESSASEESDIEELGKNLENMLANKKTSTQLSLEREEQERQELLKKIMEEQRDNTAGSSNSKGKKEEQSQLMNQGRILKITRTFKDAEGKEYTRVEIVRRQPVIDAYVKIRTTKDESFIKQFATMDEQQKEEMKREKRRIQEQLRRIKRNQERERLAQLAKEQQLAPGGIPTSLGDPKTSSHQSSTPSHKDLSPSRRKFKLKPDLKLKCGACGQVGHMRTNKACPLYTGSFGPQTSNNSTIAEEQEEEEEIVKKEYNIEPEDEDDVVNLDGTKVKLSQKFLKKHEDIRRKSLLLKVAKDAVSKKKRRLEKELDYDYYKRHNKTTNRRRTDPVVTLSSILEEVLNKMRDLADVQPFMLPVNAKLVPDYYRIITRPMDLQTIRENLRMKKYQSREEFLADVDQIVENSELYNGESSAFTAAARRMLKECVESLKERDEKLMRLEKIINPLLDDNDQVSLSFVFKGIINEIKTKIESRPFLQPVDKKKVKDYYTVIKRPMDFETIYKKADAHKYHTRSEFIENIGLIANNCEQYNGSESSFTRNAKMLVDYAVNELNKYAALCAGYEEKIQLAQERARDAEMDEGSHDESGRMSRSSDADEYVDVEVHDRPLSAASNTPKLVDPPPPPQPEVKRGRGRPRKQPVEEANKIPHVKKPGRGRGRPRKDSLTSSQGNNQNTLLEEDLQCSESDEEFEEVDEDESVVQALTQGEGLLQQPQHLPTLLPPPPPPQQPHHQQVQLPFQEQYQGEPQNQFQQQMQLQFQQQLHQQLNDQIQPQQFDLQQQHMDQLVMNTVTPMEIGNIKIEPQHQDPADESIDLDPNYDPSDFLQMPTKPMIHQQQHQPQAYFQQYFGGPQQQNELQSEHIQQEFMLTDQQSFIHTQNQQEILMQEQGEINDQIISSQTEGEFKTSNIHDDLALSDSDEEETKFMQITKEEPQKDDDEALWF